MSGGSASQAERAETIDEVLYVALIQFSELAKDADIEDLSLFQKMIFHAITNFEITPAKISEEFGLSKGTISKWMNGKAAPHPMIRRLVVNWIGEQALAKAIELDAVREAFKTRLRKAKPSK